MIVLSLDVGEVRIGVATGKLGSMFAFGRGFITRQQEQIDIEAVKEKVAQEGAELVVVGLPLRHDGEDSKQTEHVRAFANTLSTAGLEVAFEDERFTSQIAMKNMHKSGLPKKKRQQKGRLDEAAAVLILESYLAKQTTLNTL